MECEDRSVAGNEMCYLGEMLGGGATLLFSSQSLHCGAISTQGYKACFLKEQCAGGEVGGREGVEWGGGRKMGG